MGRLFFLAPIILAGCTMQHEVKAPQLDAAIQGIQKAAECKPTIRYVEKTAPGCPRLFVKPMPNVVHLNIDGKVIGEIDGGGLQVLDVYGACRSFYTDVK